jgi:hypothetical protein
MFCSKLSNYLVDYSKSPDIVTNAGRSGYVICYSIEVKNALYINTILRLVYIRII